MRMTGKPKSPVEFLEVADTPEKIQAYYQESLGPKLTKATDAGSLLAERVLYHLDRYVPKRLTDLRRKYFVPGMPANVALMCVITEIRQHRYLNIDLMELCSDVPEAITLNRVLAIAISFNLLLTKDTDYNLFGAYPPEAIGLMDMVRRNLSLARSTGMMITPVSEVDFELAEIVYANIHSHHFTSKK